MYNIPRYIINALCKQPNDLKWRFEKQLKQKIDCCKGCGDVPPEEEPVGPELETIYVDFGDNYPNGSGDILMLYGDGEYLTVVDQNAPDGIFEYTLPEGVQEVSVVLSQMFSSQQYYLEYPDGTYFEYYNGTGQESSNDFNPENGGIFKLRYGTAPLPPKNIDIETEFMAGYNYEFVFRDVDSADVLFEGGQYEGTDNHSLCNNNGVPGRDEYYMELRVQIPGPVPKTDLELLIDGVFSQVLQYSKFGGNFYFNEYLVPPTNWYIRRAEEMEIIVRYNHNDENNVYEFSPTFTTADANYYESGNSNTNGDYNQFLPARAGASGLIISIQNTPFYQAAYDLTVDGVVVHQFDNSTNYQESPPFEINDGSIIEFIKVG